MDNQNQNCYDPQDQLPAYEEQDQKNQEQDDSLSLQIEKKISNDENTQYKRQNLLKLIKKKVSDISQLLSLNQEWGFIFLSICKWNEITCKNYIGENKARAELHYNESKKYFYGLEIIINNHIQCQVCCQNKPLLKNICGCSYCIQCWKGYLKFQIGRYEQLSPLCMTNECQLRISHLLAQHICSIDPIFQKDYIKSLCRIFAKNNKNIKVCWSSDCTNCFYIKKAFELTQCNQCLNYICLVCGQQYHGSCECFSLRTWKKVTQQSLDFMTNLGFNACPQCKIGVDKYTGCNWVKCACKCQFCYVCGEKWAPNHSDHFNCYKKNQIEQMKKQNALKKQNQKGYRERMDKAVDEYFRLNVLQKKAKQRNLQELKNNLIIKCQIFSTQLQYLDKIRQLNIRGYIYVKYGEINQFLEHQKIRFNKLKEIKKNLEKIDYFLETVIPTVLLANQFKNKPDQLKQNKQYQMYKAREKKQEPIKQFQQPMQWFKSNKKEILYCANIVEKLIQND